MTIDELIKMMQASIAPCLLVSGFGFLMLTMTNRLSRAIDRIRELNKEPAEQHIPQQIKILFRRCRFLQTAIAFITLSIFFVSLVVLLLFSTFLFHIQMVQFIKILFIGSVFCLTISLVFFLLDIEMTLDSLKIEINARKA